MTTDPAPRRPTLSARTAAAAALLCLAPLAGCSAVFAGTSTLLGKDSLVVGVKADQPGLGLETSEGRFEGFDVDVALYIADHLGVAEQDVEFTGVTSAQREEVITGGEVDMVVATYSITEQRKTEVNFAGPYYVAHQDILVSADEKDVDDVRDLEGMTLCQGEGSNSANRITEEKGIAAELEEEPAYGDCVDRLADGTVDAISTDDLILAGFLASDPSAFRLVNAPFTNEKYGIGIAKEDVAGCEEVNRAVTRMYQDGTAEDLLDEWFGETGLDLVTSVPQFEGCG
ncbi:glutamate ABC transporter substrate-binding protein [Nocardiopsis composta]|uniref:Glutamate transport system substrate-binding protein n=1 Tax=Nocardiopsis composta TaxID=157465 RepID=A0A7W8VEW7_9ACTN|nr:glutamate ABC transporter substrate-binding protein [Nocardiopsis composta]MBB5433946.1 glutamate transport system substrate-binding protein [Nocardiopsis composta]